VTINYSWLQTGRIKHEVILNLDSTELFKIPTLRIFSCTFNSIRPEAKFLLKNIAHLSIYIDRVCQDPIDLHDFVKLFQSNLANNELKSNLTVDLKFPIYIDGGESGRKFDLGEELEPLRDFRVRELQVCTESADYHLRDFNMHTFRKFKVWHETLTRLDISIFCVECAEADTFGCFKNLDHLELNNLMLRRVNVNAFRGLGKLTELSLSGAVLRRLDEETFDHLESLEELHMTECGLTWLESDFFLKLKKLRLLDLRQNHMQGHYKTHLKLRDLKGNCVYESVTNPRPRKELPEDLLPALERFKLAMALLNIKI
jgi:hypothetical protein